MSNYKKYGIYGIKNKINNKIYIGKTMNNFGDRWDCHKSQLRGGYNGNKPLQHDWDEYGEENFEFIIIHDCTEKDLDFVNELEKSEICKYKSKNLAYNLHDGGDEWFWKDKHLSDETKKKIGEKNKVNMTGKKFSDETKAKMSESQRLRYEKWTDEDRKAWGKLVSKSGYRWTDEQKMKMKNNKNGATLTLEQVKEIRRLHEEEHMGYTDISNKMNIKRPTVYLIATYRRWKQY